MASITLNRKLLQACRISYTIGADGSIHPGPDAFDWARPPQVFVAGAARIDAALLIETPSEVILAFRGTTPLATPVTSQMLKDWLNDFDANLVTASGLPGQVHDGFHKSLASLWGAIKPALAAAMARAPALPLYVTGHSKGGALANLAAMRIARQLNARPRVITFAAAKPGNVEFQKAYDAALPQSIRYEYTDDIVPHVPPSDMFQGIPGLDGAIKGLHLGYASVGTLRFIDWTGRICGQSEMLRLERFTSMGKMLLTGQFDTIIHDHSIDPGSGYDKGVA